MKTWLRWGGSIALITVLATRLDWSQVGDSFASLRVEFWVLAVALFLVCQMLSSLRWCLLAGVLGFGGSLGRFIGVYFIGSFFNLILPSSVGGDVVRVWYLTGMPCTARKGRTTLATLSVFVDRASGLMILVAIACVATILSPLPLPSWATAAVALAGVGLVVGVLMVVIAGYFARGLILRLPASWQAPLARLLTAVRLYLQRPWILVGTTLLSVLIQGLNVVLVWCIGLGLGINLPLLCYGVFVPLATLLTLLPISLSGMGLREAGYALLMRPLGVAAPVAVTLSFLSFLAMAAVSFVGLGYYLFGRYPRYRPQATEEQTHERAVGGHSNQGRTGQSSAAA